MFVAHINPATGNAAVPLGQFNQAGTIDLYISSLDFGLDTTTGTQPASSSQLTGLANWVGRGGQVYTFFKS